MQHITDAQPAERTVAGPETDRRMSGMRANKRLSVPALRRAEFRAIARKILEDAAIRKRLGASDDLAGRIATAMGRIYLEGAHDAEALMNGALKQPGEIDHLDLGLLSRKSWWSFLDAAAEVFGGPYCGPLTATPRGFLQLVTPETSKASDARWKVTVLEVDGPPAWACLSGPFSNKAVGPWRRHGLVNHAETGGHLVFTQLAFRSWRAFLVKHPDHFAWRRDKDMSGYVPP
ncbi:hypothetical protein [Falsiroseomonas sp. CW058]|uniref:hypothetical protein n=1 Tax=Falsiroseomonas sp. CW058 TaxID=3388664 RepID=UPI003D317E21